MSRFAIAATRRPLRRRLAQALALALCATGAHAATYTAGTEAELIQAINDANANSGVDTINLTADILLTAALPQVTDALTIATSGGAWKIQRDDTGSNACSPTATNAFRLLDATADLTLTDLTLTGGCNLVDQGGAVRVIGANLTVARSTISGNQTFVPNPGQVYGVGGIGAGAAVINGSATLTDSTISGNAAHGILAVGGGICVYNGSLELAGSTVSGNSSTSDYGPQGGGIYAIGDFANLIPGTLTISHSTIAGNSATGYSAFGGGVQTLVEAVSITDSRITGNTLVGADTGYARGGGLIISQGSSANVVSRIERTLISGNTVSGQWAFAGGAQFVNGTTVIQDSAIVDNTVTGSAKARAGGLFAETMDLTVANSTVSGNAIESLATGDPASEGGGGMQVITFAGGAMTLRLLNSTVANNSSPMSKSAGILFMNDKASLEPSAIIESSIVAGNHGLDGFNEIGVPVLAITAPAVTANHSLFQGAIDVGSGGSLMLDGTTLSLWHQDPQLLPLALNGGSTPTQALAPTSPAIDSGTNPQSLANDQRGAGYARTVGVATDIGAYEFDADKVFANGFD